MLACFYFLLFLAHFSVAHIIEIEAFANNKTCVEDLFKSGEPISVRGQIHSPPEKKAYSIFVTIENERNALIYHSKIDPKTHRSVLVFNTENHETISFCVDNYEPISYYVELDIKSAHHLTPEDTVPLKEDYLKVDEKATEIFEGLDRASVYFSENEALSQSLLSKGISFELRIEILGGLIIILMFLVTWCQIRAIKKHLAAKKIF